MNHRTRSRAAVVLAGLTLAATGCGQDPAAPVAAPQATVTVTEAAAPEPTATPTPAEQPSEPEPPTPTPAPGVDVLITCYDKNYDEVDYYTPQDAWPERYDYCESDKLRGEPSPRELKALDVAYGKANLFSLTVLYDMCAEAHPKNYDYLRTAGSKGQVREVSGMLLLCPDHPLRDKIETYLGGAAERNRLEAQGRIFYSGTYRVGKRVQPGHYVARPRGDSCYWERTDRAGNTIDNYFSGSAVRVEATIGPDDFTFTSEGCGKWQPAG